jgi:Domain of unknown function DUF11
MKSSISVTNRKHIASFRIASWLPAIAPLWLMLATACTSANAQAVKSFGPTSVPAVSVIFGPDNVLSAAELAELSTNGCSQPMPAVKAMSFSPAPGQVFELSATGLVTFDTMTTPYRGPDGPGTWSNISSLESISGYEGPVFGLVGVFTNGSPSGPPPADYSYGGGTEPATFSPQLNQVFFIGDGTNSNSGSLQLFIVPANATELWLGFADAIDFAGPPEAYGDNAGSLIVSGTLFQGSPSLAADLFLRIIPTSTTVHQGDLITYAFPVWNLGPDIAAQEVLKTQVPAGTVFDYIRISGTPGLGTCTHTPYLGAGPIPIVCDENGDMALNTTWTVRLTVKVTAPAGTVITETAATMADNADPNMANNTATVSLTVVP